MDKRNQAISRMIKQLFGESAIEIDTLSTRKVYKIISRDKSHLATFQDIGDVKRFKMILDKKYSDIVEGKDYGRGQ